MLDKTRLIEALTLLGEDLAARGLLIEIAVYGGSALVLQFDWRRSTEDVDALVRRAEDDRLLAPSLSFVAARMDLADDWLNDAVGMYTPLDEPADLFAFAGNYPADTRTGLRVVVAGPGYLPALKLAALESLDRGERDLEDARRLAGHLRITSIGELRELYVAIHGEEPNGAAASRFASVLEC